MSILEPAIIAALSIYSLFLLAILIEYITDKRGKKRNQAPGKHGNSAPRGSEKPKKRARREEISPTPGPVTEETGEDEAPAQWREEEFE